MIANEEELVRIKILRGGTRSSISMDLYLASLLKEKLGGEAEFKTWVQTTADELERAWQEKIAQTPVGGRVRAKSGLSRLVQREAIRRVLSRDDDSLSMY
jgi:hypothetical protein